MVGATNQILLSMVMALTPLTGDVDSVDVHKFTNDHDLSEITCLSLNSYFETRGESFIDKVSMAQAVMVRVNDTREFKKYGSACSIVTNGKRDKKGNKIKHRCWYSWYCDGETIEPRIYRKDGTVNQLELKAWKDSIMAAFYVYTGMYPDIINNATHYYNPSLSNPYWASAYNRVATVGNHVFLGYK